MCPPAIARCGYSRPRIRPSSEQRINNVRAIANRLVNASNMPQIAFRPALAPGRPAIEVDTIRRKELESIPSPRVAFESGAANSTGGGGSSQPH